MAVEETLVECLRLTEGVIGLKELDVTMAQFAGLFGDQPGLKAGQGIHGDEAEEIVGIIHNDDVLVKFIVAASEGAVEELANRGRHGKNQGMRHLRQLGGTAAMEREAEARAEQDTEAEAQAEADHMAAAHECQIVHRRPR
jgi:hypothetical protein